MRILVQETTLHLASLHRRVRAGQVSVEVASRETVSWRHMTDRGSVITHQSHIICIRKYNEPSIELRSFFTNL